MCYSVVTVDAWREGDLARSLGGLVEVECRVAVHGVREHVALVLERLVTPTCCEKLDRTQQAERNCYSLDAIRL